MRLRIALAALAAAFGVAAVLAIVTTVKQVGGEHASLSQPATRL
jgi:hypothetical protein